MNTTPLPSWSVREWIYIMQIEWPVVLPTLILFYVLGYLSGTATRDDDEAEK